ncbi:MAG: GntR family transcriptional regulator [Rhodospirillales bacterium]
MSEEIPKETAKALAPAPARQESGAKSLAQQALSELRRMIIENELPPGSTHLEGELANLLKMSRTPVREAAVVLERLGLVEVRPRHGIRILPVFIKDMEEIYTLLTELESLAAVIVAEAGLSAAELQPLWDRIAEMEAALAVEDRRAWAEADSAFHSQLVALSGNSRLESVVATFTDQVQRARYMTLFIRRLPLRSNAEHRALVEAIAAGDAERARRIHRDHRIGAKNLMISLIEQAGFRSA